jgi:hypothetical protein
MQSVAVVCDRLRLNSKNCNKNMNINDLDYASSFYAPISVFQMNHFNQQKFIEEKKLIDWLKEISWRNKDYITKYRSMPLCKERENMKKGFYAATLSGLFAPTSNIHNLRQHSGFICIDIDGNDNLHITDFDYLKTQILGINGLVCSALSASGNGLFCVIKIEDPQKHLNYFWALEEDFLNMGITIDSACKNVNRLRYITYDPDPYFNFENETTYCKTIDTTFVNVGEYQLKNSVPDDKEKTINNVLLLISKIESTQTDITRSYEEWMRVGRSLANEFKEEGRELFHRVSTFYYNQGKGYKYERAECDKIYDSCVKSCSNVTIRSFFYQCAKFGIRLK